MERQDFDTLYHLLRCVCNEGDTLQSTEVTDAVYGLASHLLAGRDYLKLIQYSRYYGERFLLQPVYEAIRVKGWQPTRFVEFGGGLGWLSRGLAHRFLLPGELHNILVVDKRRWSLIDLLADLETTQGIKEVQQAMQDSDIIVMSDFLHCVVNPVEILTAFRDYPIAILEYAPIAHESWAHSYETQLVRYGGELFDRGRLTDIVRGLGRENTVIDLEPYVLVLIDKREEWLS